MDAEDIINKIVDDVIESFKLALEEKLTPTEITEVATTVNDAVLNHFDDMLAYFEEEAM